METYSSRTDTVSEELPTEKNMDLDTGRIEIYGFGKNTSTRLAIANNRDIINIPTLITAHPFALQEKHIKTTTNNNDTHPVNGNTEKKKKKKRESSQNSSELSILNRVKKISTGVEFAVALTESGDLFSWGKNKSGSLGIGTLDDFSFSKPTKIYAPEKMQDIATGEANAIALSKHSGSVYTWGVNQKGQLGLCDEKLVCSPTKVTSLPDKVIRVKAGKRHCIVLTEKKQVYCWGCNTYGQLGIGLQFSFSSTPRYIQSLKFAQIIEIESNNACYHNLALTQNRELYAWGRNNDGQIGVTSYSDCVLEPTKITCFDNMKISELHCGQFNSYVRADNRWFSCGLNTDNQLGYVTSIRESFMYREIHELSKESVIQFAAGSGHFNALLSDGRVLSMGWRELGQMGDGSEEIMPSARLVQMSGLDKKRIYKICTSLAQVFVFVDTKGWPLFSQTYKALRDVNIICAS